MTDTTWHPAESATPDAGRTIEINLFRGEPVRCRFLGVSPHGRFLWTFDIGTFSVEAPTQTKWRYVEKKK